MKPDVVTGCEALGGCSYRGDVALTWVTRWDWYDDDTGRMQYLCPDHKAERDDYLRGEVATWRTPPFTMGAAA